MNLLMLLKAFLVGGAICVVGQLLIDYTKLTPARILVLFVTLGVALTAVGVYAPLVKGVEEMVAKNGIFGVLQGGLTATAGGVAAAVFFSFLCGLVGKSGDKS